MTSVVATSTGVGWTVRLTMVKSLRRTARLGGMIEARLGCATIPSSTSKTCSGYIERSMGSQWRLFPLDATCQQRSSPIRCRQRAHGFPIALQHLLSRVGNRHNTPNGQESLSSQTAFMSLAADNPAPDYGSAVRCADIETSPASRPRSDVIKPATAWAA